MRSKFLTEKEIAALARVIPLEEWLPWQIAIETGLRIGDVCKLKWGDLSGRELSYVAEKTGKPGKAAVSEETAARLRRMRRGSEDWIFPSPRIPGSHITRQALWKRLKAACVRCRLNADGISPHSFRKVYGVREYKLHGLSAAQAGLQHSDIGTTEIYAMADWLSGENADEPLRRRDLAVVVRYIADWLQIDKNCPGR